MNFAKKSYENRKSVFIGAFKRLKTSKYYYQLNKIYIKPSDSEPKIMISYIHEYTHYKLSEARYCEIIRQLWKLLKALRKIIHRHSFNLFYLYGVKNNKDIFEALTMYERDEYLSESPKYVSLVNLFLHIYNRYRKLVSKMLLIQESVATHVSLMQEFDNTSKENKQFSKIALEYQKNEINKLSGIYLEGFLIAKKISENWGKIGLIDATIIALDIPYPSEDIIGCSEEEFDLYLEKFNPYSRWLKLYQMDSDTLYMLKLKMKQGDHSYRNILDEHLEQDMKLQLGFWRLKGILANELIFTAFNKADVKFEPKDLMSCMEENSINTSLYMSLYGEFLPQIGLPEDEKSFISPLCVGHHAGISKKDFVTIGELIELEEIEYFIRQQKTVVQIKKLKESGEWDGSYNYLYD